MADTMPNIGPESENCRHVFFCCGVVVASPPHLRAATNNHRHHHHQHHYRQRTDGNHHKFGYGIAVRIHSHAVPSGATARENEPTERNRFWWFCCCCRCCCCCCIRDTRARGDDAPCVNAVSFLFFVVLVSYKMLVVFKYGRFMWSRDACYL